MTRVRKQNLSIAGLAVVVFMLMVIFLSSPSERAQTSFEEKTSTFYTDASGTKAIYLVLKEFLPSAERWMKPLELLPPPESNNPTTLLIIGPSRTLREKEVESLDAWVERGGQLIIAAQKPLYSQSLEESEKEEPAAAAEFGEPLDYLARHGFSFVSGAETTFYGRPAEYFNSTGTLLLEGSALQRGDYTVRFGSEMTVKGGEKLLGAGRIIVIADKKVWSNHRLSQSQNAVWLVSTALSWGNGRLLIDEFHHGFQKTRGAFVLIFSFFTSLWGLAFVQLMLAGLLVLWVQSTRFGPVTELPPERQQDPLARIEALATLLQTAGAKGFALRTIHQLLLKRLWQLRYGALQAKGHSDIEKLILNRRPPAHTTDHYLSLVQRQKKGALSEEELVQASRQAGEILQEYRHGKKSIS